ncbi:MAG TPA: serine hydrolase domain-containing protein [Acidimicrobiales bacterium]|jgi:CubicO group peptidase (beta-lactamase class C family)|nr:serine hydrolase domain-containing protein [Acidimicrobiales bacterium]
MADVHGTCDGSFEGVREALANSLDAGTDVGASVAVLVEGQPVVDIWGGFADEGRSRPWERDTITNVWSTTKTMTFLCALMLADRGELDFYAPVARYWPEFAAGGKEAVEVRHLMAHSAGLSGWTENIEPEDLADWEKCTSLLAAQEPWWEPGTASGYHALTQGYLIGEVVRRITGDTIGTWFAREVAAPLGADFHIGLPAREDGRVSLIIPPPTVGLAGADPGDIAVRTFTSPLLDASMATQEWWRRAEIPAANGQGNARSVAAVQSIIAGGGEARGVRLLSTEGCAVVFDEQSNGKDLVLGIPMRYGMGYGLSTELLPMGPRACFWGGYGGSLIVMDQDTGLTVSYVMNKMESGLTGDLRGANIVMAAVMGLVGGSG